MRFAQRTSWWRAKARVTQAVWGPRCVTRVAVNGSGSNAARRGMGSCGALKIGRPHSTSRIGAGLTPATFMVGREAELGEKWVMVCLELEVR